MRHQDSPRRFVFSLTCLGLGLVPVSVQAQSIDTQTVTIVGMTPLLGTGIDLDKVPGNVQVVNPGANKDKNPGSVADMLDNQLGSISTNDYEGNSLQSSVNFRGFSASPLVGQSQGLAVYQNGMRINESFGDVVLWDLNPSFAVDRIQVMPGSNPVFGLNALGGAIALKMKDGFNNPGVAIDLGGGSFGREKATVEMGRSWGDWAFYTGLSAMNDDGWRDHSPSNGIQSYSDIAIRTGDWDLGLGVTIAASSLTGNGGTPTGILAQDWSSIFTAPDLQQNFVAAGNVRLGYQIDDTLSVQGGAYYRHLRTGLHNGNTFDPTNDAGSSCNTGNACVDTNGKTISPADNADIINSVVSTDAFGLSAQMTQDRKVAGLANTANIGASADLGFTRYDVNTEVGSLNAERVVTGTGTYVGAGQGLTALLDADNQYWGLFFTDTLSLTDRLHWTLSGRYNIAIIDLTDLQGSGLTGNHQYQRFNPGTGLTYQIAPRLTVYGSYTEANRAPTPAELGCSSPTSPCTVQSALNSDPNLKQVVSRTAEFGVRGTNSVADGGKLDWNLGVFGARNYDDIIFVMTDPTAGQGYFSNAGITERKGVEAGADATLGRLKLSASYAYTLATFASHNELPSPDNIAANANGQIDVVPGNRMPGIPLHSLKTTVLYAVTECWTVGADAKITSARTMLGDESNTMNRLGAMSILDGNTSYALVNGAVLYLRVQNVLDQRYAASGTVADPTGGGVIANTSSNTAFIVPGQPRTFWAGLRIGF